VVSYPELLPHADVFTGGTLRVGEKSVSMAPLSDVAAEVKAEYEKLKPKIVGAALSRMIVRAASAEAARAAGNRQSGALGFLAAALVAGTLVALDRPDTRSWTVLPARAPVARGRVPAGTHPRRL